MNTVFLHLPSQGNDCRAWRSDGVGLTDLGQGAPEHFAQHYPDSSCIVFIPSFLCLFTVVTLNARQLRQAGQSLAWLIEEQAGEDVANLHVIASPAQDGDKTPLLALSRNVLQEILLRLRQAGLHVVAVLPDLFLLPRDGSEWQLAEWGGGRLALRTGLMSGAVLEADVVELMLEGAWLERELGAALTVSVAVKDAGLSARIEKWTQQHEAVQCRLSDSLDVSTALSATADWTRHPANLLQGAFAIGRQFKLSAGLRIAAFFIVAAFGLQLLGEWAHYGYYKYQANKVGASAVARYKMIYPQERLSATDALPDVQKRIKAKGNESRGDNGLLPLLTRIAEAMQGSGLNTQRVDFLGGTLTLDVDARSLGDLDGFKQKLDSQGLLTEIISANSQGGVIRGRLRVEGGA